MSMRIAPPLPDSEGIARLDRFHAAARSLSDAMAVFRQHVGDIWEMPVEQWNSAMLTIWLACVEQGLPTPSIDIDHDLDIAIKWLQDGEDEEEFGFGFYIHAHGFVDEFIADGRHPVGSGMLAVVARLWSFSQGLANDPAGRADMDEDPLPR